MRDQVGCTGARVHGFVPLSRLLVHAAHQQAGLARQELCHRTVHSAPAGLRGTSTVGAAQLQSVLEFTSSRGYIESQSSDGGTV